MLVDQRVDALLVSADPFFSSRREQLAARAARHAIPTLYEWREFVEVGGLMSYGVVVRDGYYKGGVYAARVLRGANPAELPVEQLNTLELVINLKVAKALRIEVPLSLLIRADALIE
jgi:putative ABC transport system substrate-binding protein